MRFTINPRNLSLLACSLNLAAPALADGFLQGRANYNDSNVGGQNKTLNRSDLSPSNAFGPPSDNKSEPIFSPESFSVPVMTAPPAPPSLPSPPSFSLNAQSEDSSNFDGQQGVPTIGQEPQQSSPFPLAAQQAQPPEGMANPIDPDSTPDMKLLWDAWHRRVAEAVYIRYSTMANVAFANSPPIGAVAAYSVSRDGRISNVRLNQKSPNMLYNACVVTAIQSLNGNLAILQFPPNSRRLNVEKLGQFTQNYGQPIGFKTIVGDHETIPGRR